MGTQWTIKIIFSVIIIGLLGSPSAFGLPITIEFENEDICDVLDVPLKLHELGFPDSVIPPGVFPLDEEIAASHEVTTLSACPVTDDSITNNFLVTMTNNSPHDFTEVWWVGDSLLLTISNNDGQIGQPGFGALPGPAFRIDNVGLNQPLQSESISANGIFQAGETWQFVVQDFADAFPGNIGPSSFRSYGIGGVSSPSGTDMSRASIIAFTEDELPLPDEIVLCDASLDGSQMVGPVVTDATGSAQFTLNLVFNLLEWNPISFADLFDNALTIFIHGPAPTGVNAGVQLDAGALSGGVPAATTGAIMGFDVIDDTQKSDLLNGLWYIVVRNTEFPAGEIRGQIICGGGIPIGGTILPIDTTALLLAGAKMTAAWMIPVIVASIGIGIVILRKY